MTFKELNLNKNLWNALDDLGLITPTKIQAESFSTIMSGTDMVGIAQTGTGKTYAYLLPLLRMWRFSKDRFPQILIIVPTRELVVQVQEEIEKLTEYMNVVTVGVYGESNIRKQMAAVEAGLDVIVGTPGRLYDLILKGSFNTKAVKKLVIDEVDEMLNLGFRPQLTRILDTLPDKRQNLMFSATMTEEVEALLDTFFLAPAKIEAAPTGTPLEKIDQYHYSIPNFNSKLSLLTEILKGEEMSKVLVFVSTKKKADLIFERIEELFQDKIGIIHSNKSQNYRFNAINSFADGSFRILIATDLVARGLDIEGVSHVINYDLPEQAENYMHRIGRTGRVDRKGIAISFIKESELEFQENIEDLMNLQIPKRELPENVVLTDELIDEEMPNYRMKNSFVRKLDAEKTGPAFHEKKDKNKKVNRKLTLEEKRAAKAFRKKLKRSKKRRK